jgi:hypothetical protein
MEACRWHKAAQEGSRGGTRHRSDPGEEGSRPQGHVAAAIESLPDGRSHRTDEGCAHGSHLYSHPRDEGCNPGLRGEDRDGHSRRLEVPKHGGQVTGNALCYHDLLEAQAGSSSCQLTSILQSNKTWALRWQRK